MKKRYAILTAMLTLALLSFCGSAHADVPSRNWIDPLIKGEYDQFYGGYETGYETGATATLVVNVRNLRSDNMNVSAVIVGFDWGQNFSSTEVSEDNPFSIEPGKSHVFTITFAVPNTTLASNLVTHGYTIYAEDVNATGPGPKRQLNSNWPWATGSDFVVLSSDQATVKNLVREIGKYTGYTFFLSAKGRELFYAAQGAANDQGYNAYTRGDFSGAVTYYQEALTDYQNAWSNETEFETSLKSFVDTGQNALNMVGLGYVLFGVGLLLIGIGVLVYGIRKSGHPKVPA
jgi:hypothetical protein